MHNEIWQIPLIPSFWVADVFMDSSSVAGNHSKFVMRGYCGVEAWAFRDQNDEDIVNIRRSQFPVR